MKENPKAFQLKKEILAIILLTLSLAILLSLFSYSPFDPSLSFYRTTPREIENFFGIVGSYLSDWLFQALGLSSYLLALIIFQFSVRLFLTLDLSLRLTTATSLVFLVVSASAILDLILGKTSFRNFSGNAGGIFGYITSDLVRTYLNPVGSFIFLALVFIVSLIVSTSLSFRWVGKVLALIFSFLGRGVRAFVKNRRSLFSGKQKKPREKKMLVLEELPQTPANPLISTSRPTREPAPEREVKGGGPAHAEKPPELKAKASPAGFTLPILSLLQDSPKGSGVMEKEFLLQNSRLLENKLKDYGVQARVVNVYPGPVITRYELEPAPGVKINRIVNLADDLALALRAMGIRIIAPIPGKAAIGVEIPNQNRETVFFKDIVAREEFRHSPSPLTLGLGKDISGLPIITDLAKMPHLLIAGTTGSGKSVFINAMICSILYKATPSEVKLLIMDPKRSELTMYEDIPHLLYPIVTDAKRAAEALRWSVEEMERRYHLLATMGSRDILGYNLKVEKMIAEGQEPGAREAGEGSAQVPHRIPWIVIVIDELANLMMVSTREVEWCLARLAQMARAAGIHLLVATQRPSVDVITGMIKANFPARISFRLASKTDSRTILDTNGAESLLDHGDMLFLSPRTSKLQRIHGSYLSDDEIQRIAGYIKAQAPPEYQDLSLESSEEEGIGDSPKETDEKYAEAVALVTNLGQASISLIQRKLRIGYNRAARIIEKMEEDGIVGPSDGIKPREVLSKFNKN